MFDYEPAERKLTLKERIESELVAGRMCPSFTEKQLYFTIDSDRLGSKTVDFLLKVAVREQF